MVSIAKYVIERLNGGHFPQVGKFHRATLVPETEAPRLNLLGADEKLVLNRFP
jgi:hypothetical protein